LKAFRSVSGGALPLIAAGAKAIPRVVRCRDAAGACLVQLYSAMVYQGPGIARRISSALADRLAAEGYSSISELVGQGAA
jgi:dihydroorotate dehydrogenase